MLYLSTIKTGNVRKFRIANDVIDGWNELNRADSIESLRDAREFWKKYYRNLKPVNLVESDVKPVKHVTHVNPNRKHHKSHGRESYRFSMINPDYVNYL